MHPLQESGSLKSHRNLFSKEDRVMRSAAWGMSRLPSKTTTIFNTCKVLK